MDGENSKKDGSAIAEGQQPVENRAPTSMDPEHVGVIGFMLVKLLMFLSAAMHISYLYIH